MKKTLINNFLCNTENGSFALKQACSDVKAAINIIFDVADDEDVTDEEFKVLYEAIKILRRHDK